jgi:hypothetical protein
MIISSEVDPKEIIKRMKYEWAHMNGAHLQIKELQHVNSKTIVSIYKVSKLTPKEVILTELKKILLMAQDKARENSLDKDLYDFLMDMDVAIGETLPDMTLHVQTSKLRDENVSTFDKLNKCARYAWKTWHLEVASKYATKMKGLVQMAKDYGCVEHYWGVHTHLSEVIDLKFTANEAKRQVVMAQKHTNCKVSMTLKSLLV